MFARQQVAALMGVKDQLDQHGITLVAIGSGSTDQAVSFVNAFGFTGEMYTSRDLAAYRAFRLVRGVWQSLGPASIYRGFQAMKNGFRQGPAAGDPWQQGGAFLLGPGERLRFAHRDRFAGDHADLGALLAAARQSAETAG